MPEGHDTTIEVSNIMSFVLYTQILKQSVLKPASPGITLIHLSHVSQAYPLHYSENFPFKSSGSNTLITVVHMLTNVHILVIQETIKDHT